MPGAIGFGADFAFAVLRAAAGAVQEFFGAAGDRTDPPEDGEFAIAAAGTLFGKDPLFFQNADEGGVDSR
jgi:hypothetical protein